MYSIASIKDAAFAIASSNAYTPGKPAFGKPLSVLAANPHVKVIIFPAHREITSTNKRACRNFSFPAAHEQILLEKSHSAVYASLTAISGAVLPTILTGGYTGVR
jgi:hypothetical protein